MSRADILKKSIRKLSSVHKKGTAFIFEDSQTRNLLFKAVVRSKAEQDEKPEVQAAQAKSIGYLFANRKAGLEVSNSRSLIKNELSQQDLLLHKIYQISRFKPHIDTSMSALERQKLLEDGRLGARAKDSLTERSQANLSGSQPEKSSTVLNEQLTQRDALEYLNSRSKATTHRKPELKLVDSKKKSLPLLKTAYTPEYYISSAISRDTPKLATLEQSYSKASLKQLSGWSRPRAANFNLTYREESSSRLLTERTCDDVLSDVKALKEKFKDELNIL